MDEGLFYALATSLQVMPVCPYRIPRDIKYTVFDQTLGHWPLLEAIAEHDLLAPTRQSSNVLACEIYCIEAVAICYENPVEIVRS
jgi:hypothetical protein